MSKTLHITQDDFILANKRADREEEIRLHGRQTMFRHTAHESKKTYNRRRLPKIETD